MPSPPPFPTPTQAHVDEAVRRLVAAFAPEKIVVFGSFARGEARPGSDLDLLLVLPVVQNRFRAAGRALAALGGDLPVDVVVVTPEQAADAVWWGVVRRAQDEGIVVYDRQTALENACIV